MRLLHIASDGRLRWAKECIGNEKVPDYAILSHTWGEQEVIFDDLKNLDSAEDIGARSKAGWDKIRFCAQQTKRDGLDHFWVDTCCIDKSNSQELQEAINSMFRWYQNAEKCYVYLSDVKCNTPNAEDELGRRWKPVFRKSRWFTRGWTLQELLAPASVSFYSKEGVQLGDKQSLRDTIHEITGIPVEALSGSRLSDFSVEDRFSWAGRRQTTREEDLAYSMLGIFGACMPLIYGEGRWSAFRRLRKVIDEHTQTTTPQAEILTKNQFRLFRILVLARDAASTLYMRKRLCSQVYRYDWLAHNLRLTMHAVVSEGCQASVDTLCLQCSMHLPFGMTWVLTAWWLFEGLRPSLPKIVLSPQNYIPSSAKIISACQSCDIRVIRELLETRQGHPNDRTTDNMTVFRVRLSLHICFASDWG